MTKKFISLFLSFALVFSLLGTTAFAAANDLEIEGDTVVCENAPGSEISYHVNLKTNPGFTSGKIAVSWDGTALKLKEVVYSAYPNASSPPIPAGASSYAVSFGNDLNSEDYTTTGPAFEMKFEILGGAVSKKYDLTITADPGDFPGIDIVDPKVKNVVITNGSITLREKLTGDLPIAIVKPVKGNTPQSTITATAQYTGTIAWEGNPTTFAANTVYTAKVKLTANTGYQFADGVNPTVAGSNSVTDVTVKDSGSKLEFKATFPKTNDKDPATITNPPTANTLTYTGSEQELVTAGSGVTGGTLKYRLGESGTWSTAIPKAEDAKNYTVYYKVVGDSSHSDSVMKSVTVTIVKKNIGDSSVTVDAIAGVTYDGGNELKPLPVVKDGTATLTKGTDYTVSYTNNTNAGTATVTITGKGNYTNTKTANFTINPKNVAANKGTQNQNVVLNVGDFTKPVIDSAITGSLTYSYDGANTYEAVKTKLAALSVGATGDIDYTFTANGNYTGTITGKIHFTIVDLPAATVTTAPVAKTGLVYSGTEQVLITAGTANGGTMQYSLNGTDWSTAIPKAKDAKNYTVYYKVVGDSSHSDSVVKSVTVTIGKKPATVAPKSYTITKGSAIPIFELAYTGLVSGESLTPSTSPIFTCFEADGTTPVSTSTAAGSYTITWTNMAGTTFTVNTNYAVTTTATANLTINNPSSSGGGSYTPSYSITVDKTENGTITVSPKSASKGDTVTITVKPDKGYELEMLKALDKDGDALKLTEKNGKYTFKMPSGKVTVKGSFVEEAPVQIFKDVPVDAYYYEAVKWAAEKGITGGVGNGLFAPNQPCTRAQIVTFLWRAAGSPAPKHMSSFTDVSADAFYAKAVAWAVENGITGGTGDGKFSPDATCTRAQSVTFLYRAAGSPKVSGSAEFGDVATNAYYADAVAWAAKNGITGGIGGGLFGSGNDCTRAQIVTFLYRSVK